MAETSLQKTGGNMKENQGLDNGQTRQYSVR